MPAPLLAVSGACRRFAATAALNGVDLGVAPGELLALLGPNGAGKTSLLRAIAGRLRLDSGSVQVRGEDPRTVAAARACIGVVPQTIALYEALPVGTNLEIFARLYGLGGRRLRSAVTEALQWTGLADRAGMAIRDLSGGMQRRVNIAAGTLHDPSLLLLDEPTVGLDPAVRGTIHEVLALLKARGMGIVLTTHDLQEAAELADRVVFMNGGMICAEGQPAALVEEMFASDRELIVMLHADPLEQSCAALQAAGLQATSRPRLWVGQLGSDFAALEQLRTELETAGVPLAELRLREPGLDGVFLRLTGQVLE